MFKFLYQFLFIDQEKKRLSTTKFWSHIGYLLMCYTFVYAVMYESKADVLIWLIFGGVVIGNRSIMRALEMRAGLNNKGDDNG